MDKVTGIVLRDEPEVAIPSGYVPVTVDFDPRRPPIGRATLRREGDNVVADMEFLVPVTGIPAVGIRNGEIVEVSIGFQTRNVDPTIQPISTAGLFPPDTARR